MIMTGFVALIASAQAQTIPTNQQIMKYDVYAGGIHALQSKLDIIFLKILFSNEKNRR